MDIGENSAESFKIWVSNQSPAPGHLGMTGATLKTGRDVCKTATLAKFGNRETGEIRKQQLTVTTAPAFRTSPGYDFDNPSVRWSCEDEEIHRLVAFLTSEVEQTGRYRLIDAQSPASLLDELLTVPGLQMVELLRDLLERDNALPALRELLAADDSGMSLAQTIVLGQRRTLIEELQRLARTDGVTETQMQEKLGEEYWVFGGRYVGVASRNLTPLDQHDIPLLSADGTLHIVELKGPCVPHLVRRHRNHYIVGTEVHQAVSQAMNYLRALDELGSTLTTMYANETGESYDFRRVFATIVIGHPDHVRDGCSEKIIDQTLRTYNSHLSRLEVRTYKEVLESAERTLAFEEASLITDGRGGEESTASVDFDEPPF